MALTRNIRRLADQCPVLMLQRAFSHEPLGTLSVFRLLGGRYPVFVAETIQQVALIEGGTWVVSNDWRFESLPDGPRVGFSCIPTVNKAAVAAVVGATAAADSLGELLAGYALIHRVARTARIAAAVVSRDARPNTACRWPASTTSSPLARCSPRRPRR